MAQNPLRRPSKGAPMKKTPEPDFYLKSRSRPDTLYPMAWTPEGFAIHDGEDCEGVRFRGVLGCWHSQKGSKTPMTQALVRAEAVLTPAPLKFNDEQMGVIKSTIAKGATDAELALFVATCERTGLDPFMRQIYAVKRWDNDANREVMAIQVGIDGMRLIAERTGKYAGQSEAEWLTSDGEWTNAWFPSKEGDVPLAARVKVYRKDWPDHAAVGYVRFDSYKQTRRDGNLNATWRKMPDVMIAKCAENAAMHKAFPAEMSAIAGIVGESYDPTVDGGYVERIDPEDVIEGEVVKPEPAAPAQPRQTAQKPRNAPATPNTPAETPQTPPAPPEGPSQASGDPRKLVPQILSEILQSQGREQYVIVGKDLLATFPAAKHPENAALRPLNEVDGATVEALVARLRVWQSGENPNASRPPESDNSEAEVTAECVNCHVMQVVDPATLTDDTPCSACGQPIGVEIVPDEAFQ